MAVTYGSKLSTEGFGAKPATEQTVDEKQMTPPRLLNGIDILVHVVPALVVSIVPPVAPPTA
jgi:hypothetical protein